MNIKLSVSRIVKSYGKKKVLEGCTVAFGTGVTAVMGPNGCGKSTLLRICALLERPTSGDLKYYYASKGVPHDLKLMRKISLVLPRTGIFNTTVWKNASYGLGVRGTGRREKKARTKEILNTVGLYERRKQNALSLSNGEAQRLVLARAMVLEPEVLFLDEPTASLDEENAAIVEGIILGMKKPGGPTVIIATHDRAQAERLADRTLVIRQGKLAPVDRAAFDDPARTGGRPGRKGRGHYINPDFFE
jgi:tungstate transport system ATP-binding protein